MIDINKVIKPAFQTLEGKLYTAAISVAGIAIFKLTGVDITTILTQENFDKAMKSAKSVEEMVQVYRMSEMTLPQAIYSGFSAVKLGAVLFFAYKILDRFLEKRSDLKQKYLKEIGTLLLERYKKNEVSDEEDSIKLDEDKPI